RRISAKTGRTLATSVQTVSADGMVASVDAYRQNVKVALEDIMLLNPECALQVSNWSYPPKKIQPSSLPITPERISDQGELDQDMTNLPLELADFIISAGNGLTDWKAFHHLAQRINATIGGTRVVCDNGFLSKSRQVGSSGSLVNARCYLALGIAGAPQHLQGISNCKHVIAINTDLYADMVKRADISIIADVQKIIPALLIQLQKMDKTNADQT
ncbi:Electron transfer flavoprotein, alpha subunit, partial [hydrothermal vent metagenome]